MATGGSSCRLFRQELLTYAAETHFLHQQGPVLLRKGHVKQGAENKYL